MVTIEAITSAQTVLVCGFSRESAIDQLAHASVSVPSVKSSFVFAVF
jgi:hypothetical protein